MKYKINSKVREHRRKLRKEARKAKKNGLPFKSAGRVTRIPNSYPEKKQLIEMEEELSLLQEIEKTKNPGVSKKELEQIVLDGGNANVISHVNEDNENFKENMKKSKNEAKRELNEIIQKSDFIVEVIDARDPLAYRSKGLENNVLKNKDKRLIILINKAELISR
jgi:nuclear GTP-binding protein